MDYEAVIGLEIHVEMKTKSKMFSSAPVSFGYEPNTQTIPLDLAFPGTMPTVNKQAVINAIRVSHALHMDIDRELWFDRKNYFYSDLPKGYQITQQHRPIGKNGYLTVNVGGVDKKIRIERLHMEEDTCKQLHSYDCTLLDYNRAGVPLIEIVSLPDIRSGEEASKYVEQIRSIVTFLDVSDGKMEEGSLRCDVNISIRPVGSETFGTKVEIKNLNSINNIEKAIDYEIEGSHVELGVNIAKKFHEDEIVLNAIASHHGDTEQKSVIAVLVQIADTLSAARPGARNDSVENYIKRLEALEEIGNSFEGVEKTYAIQAGREIRVMVRPEEVSDDSMIILARNIANKIDKNNCNSRNKSPRRSTLK